MIHIMRRKGIFRPRNHVSPALRLAASGPQRSAYIACRFCLTSSKPWFSMEPRHSEHVFSILTQQFSQPLVSSEVPVTATWSSSVSVTANGNVSLPTLTFFSKVRNSWLVWKRLGFSFISFRTDFKAYLASLSLPSPWSAASFATLASFSISRNRLVISASSVLKQCISFFIDFKASLASFLSISAPVFFSHVPKAFLPFLSSMRSSFHSSSI
mmetsp:Transcript_30873/g.60661  ORF Transcript_30873/g.60661 Transcript_30873/m.60661 type:complete len:213 (+) Transcript_30873:3-641(+)